MDLRKAIDKAKKERQEKGSPAPDRTGVTPAQPETSGWLSPVYSESRSIELDPQVMAANRCVCFFPEAPEIEPYKLLRTQIQLQCKEKGWNTVMVTSINHGEGKTLTAINLAMTFAKEYSQTVFLVDCDLDRQNIHKYLGIAGNNGLIDYLTDEVALKDLIVWPGIEKMTLISGGKTIRDSAELLNSPRMKSLVREMKTRYQDRYVLFDVPPILASSDAIAFAPLVDCILIVVQAQQTAVQDINRALEMIPKDKLLGFVLNRQPL